jgi:hypothetical protein
MPWMRRLCPDFGRCGCAAAFGNASYRLFIDTERRRCALTDAEVRTTQTRAEKKRHGAGDASACAELDFFFWQRARWMSLCHVGGAFCAEIYGRLARGGSVRVMEVYFWAARARLEHGQGACRRHYWVRAARGMRRNCCARDSRCWHATNFSIHEKRLR